MIVTFGEILLRLSTPQKMRLEQTTSFDVQYGGSESNVAVALARWNNATAFVTRLPDQPLGWAARNSLRAYGVNADFILWGGERLGTYFLETGAGMRAAQVLYDRKHSALSEIRPGMLDWESIFEQARWFHWSGITPALSLSAAETVLEACETAHKLGIRISTDLNYRAKLWKYGKKPAEIMPDLLRYCDVVTGGIDAPEKILGIVPEGRKDTTGTLSEADIQSIFDQLKQKFPKISVFATTLRHIIHSDHHRLQGVVYANGKLFFSQTHDLQLMLDRVGGGDAFVAGILHGLLHFGPDYERIVRFATAASVIKHYTHGDVNLATLEEVEKVAMEKGGTAIER